jgi:phosphohistidine swiveling domain-containing protein
VDTMLVPLNQRTDTAMLGNKARNLQRLQQLGTPVPETYCIPWSVHDAYRLDPTGVDTALAAQIDLILRPERAYAVRSSANAEDALGSSFAGQFQSFLNVQGTQAILEAVKMVWDSLQRDTILQYLDLHGIAPDTLKMGVLVQEMVPPQISGVAFSRNPLTGLRETVIEAVEGPGTALMESGITPMRWIFHHKDFLVKEENAPIALSTIRTIVDHTRTIAQKAGTPVDLEWVWDGVKVAWVQMRPITAMDKARLYSNRISKEMLAGQIKPLIWDVNIPLVNGAWIALLTRVIGPNRLTPHDLAKSFYYRTYFNMGLLGEVFEKIGFSPDALEIMWGVAPRGTEKVSFKPDRQVMKLLPRMLAFLHYAWRIPGKFTGEMDRLERTFRRTQAEIPHLNTPEQVLSAIAQHAQAMREAAHLNILIPLSAVVYAYILRTRLERAGLDFTRLDMTLPERHYDPHPLIRALKREWLALPEDLQKAFAQEPLDALPDVPAIKELMSGFAALLHAFGHLSDNGNDFSYVPWREDPERVRQMILDHEDLASAGEDSQLQNEAHLSGPRHAATRFWYRRARLFAGYREQVSYVYTFGFGLFRPLYRTLERLLTERGILAQPDDIFFLTHQEAASLALGKGEPGDIQEKVTAIRADMEATQALVLPELIFGDDPPPPLTEFSDRLTGVATSRGYAQGTARIVPGREHFSKVMSGDIIVIPHSDVSWTPLFSRAAGVVAESGGILSHSSIVAREYGIPAVVSVNGAMTRLRDGDLIRMDGFKGEVLLLQGESEEPSEGGRVDGDRTAGQ